MGQLAMLDWHLCNVTLKRYARNVISDSAAGHKVTFEIQRLVMFPAFQIVG